MADREALTRESAREIADEAGWTSAPKLEAVVLVRINDPDAGETVAQATIVVPTSGQALHERIGAALVNAGLAEVEKWSYT